MIALVKVALFMVSLIHLARTQAVSLSSGPVNTTAIIGQNLTLNCTFPVPVDGNLNILWKKSNIDIGRCQMSYECDNFGDSRTSFKESNRTHFELQVTNVSRDDSGSYECGFENRSLSKLIYSRLQAGVVSVIPRTTPVPRPIHDSLDVDTAFSPTQNSKVRIFSTDPNGMQSDQRETTNNKMTPAPSEKNYATPAALNSYSDITFASFPSWIKYLVYYCSVASSLALALAVMMVAYLCAMCRRRKPASQADVEQQPQIAKVAAIPSHTSDDYATIDSSKLKQKSLKCDDTVDELDPRERKESFRYFQPNKVAPMTTGTLEVATTSDGYATPSIPKRRTQSEYRASNCDGPTNFDSSNSRQPWRNRSLQEHIPYRMGTTAIDEESTIDSRLSISTNKGQNEVFYFPLDEIDTGDVDDNTMKSSMSDETTLGRQEHSYVTLEQTSQGDELKANRENNNYETMPKITNDNNVSSDLAADSGYDNFRSNRIPYLRENSTTDNYEKLKCNSKG